jgi:hypothetical protein
MYCMVEEYSYMEHLLSIGGQRKEDEDRFYPFVPLRENAHAPKCRQPKAREVPVSTGICLTCYFGIRSTNFAHQKNATFNPNKTIIMC